MKLYVVAHHYALFDDSADEYAYLIGVFDSKERAEQAKREYLDEFDYPEEIGGERSVSITETDLNIFDFNRPFNIDDVE